MFRKCISLLIILAMVFGYVFITKPDIAFATEMRRVIDNTHPLNIVSYYKTDNETIPELWSSIPNELKPYTALFLISEPKNTASDKQTIEDSVAICQQNNIPCIVQIVNGEIKVSEHIPVSFMETLLQKYSCLIGFNGAELYNSIGWYGETEGNHSQYLADIVNLVSNYGAYLVWTDTNIFGTNGTILDWIQNNSNLISALRAHHDNFIMMYKESYGSYNTDSVSLGLWLCGLASNWGISSDWWHWQVDGYQKLFTTDPIRNALFGGGTKKPLTWPEALYVSSMLRGISEGATCFTAEAGFYSVSLHGIVTPAFSNAILPVWQKIIDGTYRIPSKEEVLAKNKFAYLGNAGFSVPYTNQYSNLYMPDGRYGIIPVIPANANDAEKANFDLVSTSPTDLNALYPKEVLEGNTFASRNGDQWIWMNHSENTDVTQFSKIKPQINTSDYFKIEGTPHTSMIMRESESKFTGHISNYRVDKSALWGDLSEWNMNQAIQYIKSYSIPGNANAYSLRTTTITVRGAHNGEKPLLNISGNNGFTYSETFDRISKLYTLKIKHNGPINFEITADGSNLPMYNEYSAGDVSNLSVKNGSPVVTPTVVSTESGWTVRMLSNSGDNFVIDNNSSTMRDGTYSFSMRPSKYGRCGGIIRYVDNNNYTWVGYQNDSSWRIRECINGISNDTVVSRYKLSEYDFHSVKIVAKDKYINVSCDNNLIYSGTLPNTAPAVAGKVGFVVWSVADACFDNVAQSTEYNLAIGRTINSNSPLTNASYMTDGDKNTNNYMNINNPGLQWVQLDLGQSRDISNIKMWHYFGDTRKYHDVIVQVSNDSNFTSGVITVFNNDADNSAGLGAGTDTEYMESADGKDIVFGKVSVRYIRFYSNGSTANAYNHFVEAEVY